MTIHSGDEQLIWEGESQNLTARATGGRVAMHYRLTTHFLYFETGGITGTKQEQIPLINVQDVDISQSLIQKSRKVGNVLVHLVRAPGGWRETATLDWVPDPTRVRDLINGTVHQVRLAAHQRQLAEQQNLNVHRFEQSSGAPMPPGVPGVPLSSAPPQPAASPEGPEQIMAMLKQLGDLRDAGVLTPEEFEAKKKDLLNRL
jgi:hypothetical protein